MPVIFLRLNEENDMSFELTKFDITIIKHRDFSMNVYLRDFENNPLNLTDWTGKCQVRERMSPDSDLLIDSIVTIANAAAGKVNIFMAKANTGVCVDTGAWDLMMTNADGHSDTYVIGDVTFIDVPTKE